MGVKLNVLLLVIAVTVLIVAAQENPCCGEIQEIFFEVIAECAKDNASDEDIEKCAKGKFDCFDEDGKEDLDKINAFIDKFKCEEEYKKPLRDNSKECLNDNSPKCKNDFFEICPVFCEFLDPKGEHKACQKNNE